MEIIVRYSSCDGYSERRKFKTLKGAQKFAHKWVGEHPEIGSSYAVSGEGIGKVTVSGCSLRELFPEKGSVAGAKVGRFHVARRFYEEDTGRSYLRLVQSFMTAEEAIAYVCEIYENDEEFDNSLEVVDAQGNRIPGKNDHLFQSQEIPF